MNYWDFTSDNNWFSLKLPENWAEYDDEDNVFAFFNTEKWSGNLRISHLRRQNDEKEVNDASFYTGSEFADKPGVMKVKLGDWDATFYSKGTNEGDIIYFWATGSKNDLFICSFTFDKPFLGTDWHNNELIAVGEILGSIKVIYLERI